MNKTKSQVVLGLVLALSMSLTACSSTVVSEKSTKKACYLQAKLINFGTANDLGDLKIGQQLRDMSIEVANLAEEDSAGFFWDQVDFFNALTDANTPSGWEPSEAMNKAQQQIPKICKVFGITF